MKNAPRLFFAALALVGMSAIAAVLVRFDINDKGTNSPTATGWTAVTGAADDADTIAGTNGTHTLTLATTGDGQDRDGGTASFTADVDLWRDSWVVNTPTSTATATISGLAANTSHIVNIWGYDKPSTGARSAPWTDTVSGNSRTLSFDGATSLAPMSLNDPTIALTASDEPYTSVAKSLGVANSAAESVPQLPPLLPAAPTYLNATAGDAQVSLNWTAPAVATGYIVSRSTTNGGGYAPVATVGDVNSFTDMGLTNGTTYYYVVAAQNADGASANSAPASATPAQTFPQWAAGAFPGQSDPAIIGPGADPDRDGRTNLAEYFAGTNANSSDISGSMSLNVDDPTNLGLTFQKSRNLAGVSYSVEKSIDLKKWIGIGLLPRTLSQQSGYDIMQVIIPNGATDKLFLRLVISTSPQDGLSNSVRERISINNDWRFAKYASQNAADGLIYDTRSDIVNGTTPLKSYILPTGNDFIKNLARRYVRPAGNPGSTFPYVLSTFDDSSWTNLNLPHDWAIAGPFNSYTDAAMGRLPSPGVGWYRKKLDMPLSDAGKSIFLDVDGAMSYAMVWLNGNLVGGWPYGYSSWRLDLTPYVVPGGTNQLAIRVDNPTVSSRWYPGGGIYRNVWLTRTQPVHVGQWGTYLTTTNVSAANATINLKVTIENDSASNTIVVATTQIVALDSQGNKIGDAVADIAPATVSIKAGASATVTGAVTMASPRLWGPPPTQVPNRYVAVTTLWQDGELIDTYETPFGIRKLTFDPNAGLYVNGERISINGVNQHHDLGALGAAFNVRAAQRQLEGLREMGCNAIRMSHNPPAPELLDLCDQMGFLVLDEIFDCWLSAKPTNDFHLIFADWHEQDLRAMVRRDRNHPSIIIWSFGNEVVEQFSGASGATLGRELRDTVREEDPTRPTTVAINANNPSDPLPAVPDLIGLNYRGEGIRDSAAYAGLSGTTTPPQYQAYHAAFPTKVILSTENAAAFSTRGEYLFPVTPYTSAPLKDGDGGDSVTSYASAYELYSDAFGKSADTVFAAQDQNPFVAGGFVWSGWDYLGEPSPYWGVARSSYYGIIDLAGFKKDRFYLYQSRWLPDLPMVHILPHWTWPGREGQVTPVHVFTTGDEAELLLNGVSLGRKSKGVNEYRLRWDDAVYQPGTLTVVAYKKGRVWAQSSVSTVGAATGLVATADRSQIKADGLDLSFVTVRVADVNGKTVPRAKNALTFSITGPGQIAGTDNGDPTNLVSFTSTNRTAFNGYCLVIVRGISGQPGTIQVTAQSGALGSTTVTLQSAQ